MPPERPVRDGTAAAFELIETMRWEPGIGVALLPLHVERLERSAGEFGFAFDREAFLAEVAQISTATTQRLRIALDREGTLSVVMQDFALQPPDTVWSLRVAAARLDSADPLLRHKTSARARYDSARAEFTPAEADEVIMLNERDEVCEGTIMSVFVERDGILVTPPLDSGVLAGVCRRSLIDSGRARETVVTLAELESAGTLFVGNALRGLIRAKLG